MMALSCPFKEHHQALSLSAPLSSRRWVVRCPWLTVGCAEHFQRPSVSSPPPAHWAFLLPRFSSGTLSFPPAPFLSLLWLVVLTGGLQQSFPSCPVSVTAVAGCADRWPSAKLPLLPRFCHCCGWLCWQVAFSKASPPAPFLSLLWLVVLTGGLQQSFPSCPVSVTAVAGCADRWPSAKLPLLPRFCHCCGWLCWQVAFGKASPPAPFLSLLWLVVLTGGLRQSFPSCPVSVTAVAGCADSNLPLLVAFGKASPPAPFLSLLWLVVLTGGLQQSFPSCPVSVTAVAGCADRWPSANLPLLPRFCHCCGWLCWQVAFSKASPAVTMRKATPFSQRDTCLPLENRPWHWNGWTTTVMSSFQKVQWWFCVRLGDGFAAGLWAMWHTSMKLIFPGWCNQMECWCVRVWQATEAFWRSPLNGWLHSHWQA